ncbi:glycosyltransferase family 2 protein [Microbacterium sp. NPDC058345]|uniref:glycosyltransferase family 2 protein n=1 Tax=Microbacterium sp. NPDC058345 TaxID=3346455 RepID=UPI0036480B84
MTEDPKALPSVSVVIPAHKRPVELRAAIAAVVTQDYAGPVDVVVVFDRAEPDLTLTADGSRPVRVLSNQRTAGLAGARNTGILSSSGELVAFCDDDDVWLPEKLSRQVTLLDQHPDAPMATTAIVVDYGDRSTVRLAGTDTVTHDMLLASRMSMLHSSNFLFRRSALEGALGLINEQIPGSQNEDWDILLRSSALHPVVHLDEPLVRVLWGKSSHFSRRWDTKIASSEWMLDNHPDVAKHRTGASRLMGQIAFAYASEGRRSGAWRWAGRSLKRNPLQWRSWVSLAVAVVPGSSERVLGTLHRWGRGV